MKYIVRYVYEVEITYEAIVEANSEEEARQKMEDFDFETEEEIDRQGINVNIYDVEEIDE